jgi:hypothetical protein
MLGSVTEIPRFRVDTHRPPAQVYWGFMENRFHERSGIEMPMRALGSVRWFAGAAGGKLPGQKAPIVDQ